MEAVNNASSTTNIDEQLENAIADGNTEKLRSLVEQPTVQNLTLHHALQILMSSVSPYRWEMENIILGSKILDVSVNSNALIRYLAGTQLFGDDVEMAASNSTQIALNFQLAARIIAHPSFTCDQPLFDHMVSLNVVPIITSLLMTCPSINANSQGGLGIRVAIITGNVNLFAAYASHNSVAKAANLLTKLIYMNWIKSSSHPVEIKNAMLDKLDFYDGLEIFTAPMSH